MKIIENFIGNYPFIKIEEVKDLDVGKIFDCGQCFRFKVFGFMSYSCCSDNPWPARCKMVAQVYNCIG